MEPDMLEETRQTTRLDPSTSHHRPASGKSQDISHVLAGIFKDLYTRDAGKDVVSNLTKTRPGGGSFQDRYVEELQQAHREYTECIKEADMLEAHIIQARAQAAAKESEALKKMKRELGDEALVVDYEGLLTVKSLFSWCVDGNLLKRKGLISPQDYLTSPKTQMKAPKAVKQNPARPTFVSTMRATRADGGGTLLVRCPEKIHSETKESECMTLDSTSCISNVKETPSKSTKPRSTWKEKPDADEWAEGLKKRPNLRNTQNFLHNPRFLPPSARRGGSSLIRSKVLKTEQGEKMNKQGLDDDDDPVPVFLPNPPVLLFSEYSVGDVYEITLELENMTSSCRNLRVIPPTTPYFSISLDRFPGDGSVVAPGMSCKYAVRFAPDSLGDYEDFIVVETQAEHKLVVPIEAHRPPPVLTLPSVLDCGYCLIGGVKFVEFRCQNVGLSSGTFCFIPKNQWPPSNLRSVGRTYFSEQPPFAVSPSVFGLQPGEATVVEVVFFPTTAEEISQVFTVVCDNCQVKDISVRGEGQRIALELVSGEDTPVAGDVLNLTADHFVHVGPCNPESVQQKAFVIRNNVHLELPFTWQIIKPNLHTPRPGETPEVSHVHFHLAKDDIFHISPQSGVLAPCQDQEFLLTFCPKELQDYHSVCHLILRDTPQLPPEEPCDEGVLQPVRTGSKVSDVIGMEIEVKGSTEPYQVLLEPYAILIPGELYIFTTTRKRFTMWNYSKTCISFHWERMIGCHIIEVEPSTGRIEVNKCFDFELMVTGGKPERVVTRLVCHIEHHHGPVTLALEVSFKGAIVTVNVPSLDFGLLRLGEQTTATLVLTNTTHLEASWTLEEVHKSHQDRQIRVKPASGVLPPLANCSVDVLFTPHFCQKLETELELTVENGTGCHLSLRADVQSPQVSLLSPKLDLTELYFGIPAVGCVTLVNQTTLPSNFSWMAQLQGQQAALCAVSFEPSSGTLGPNASTEVGVHLTSHTELELSDVAALCEVEGMNSPLVLHIGAPRTKTLRVSYSLPGVCCPPDDQSSSALVLNFGDDVILKSPVVKQLLLTNETAIPTSFSIEVEYFTCNDLKPSKPPGKRLAHMKKPLHSFQAKKVEEKARTDFVNNLLANGKGAAFFVQPSTGQLGAWETRTVEVTAYSDMWGEYTDHLRCKVGDLAPTLIPMQMTVKGCPLYFQITGPRPDNQNQGPDIRFGTHLSGEDTVSRSLRINNPTMFDIRIDWETYNIDANDRNLVDVLVVYGKAFPIKDADGNEILGEGPRLCSRNVQTASERTPSSEGSSSSVHSVTDLESKDCDAALCPKKLFSVHIRPHVGNRSDYPFCITPQQIVIPAKSSRTIQASFTPLNLPEPARESSFTGLALGFMSLDSETASCVVGKVIRAQGLNLDPIRMDLQAAVTPAVLSVLMEEDHGVLEFHASAGDLLRLETDELREFDVVRTFQLKNQSERELSFRLETQRPFLVLKLHPHAPIDPSSSQSLILQPYRNMQVKVAFHCSLTLLEHADEADEDVPSGVTLIHSAGGQRQLRFQQNLLIHYSNNSLQAVPLRAHLTLTSLSLSADSVNFGLCVTRQTQTTDVNLYSHGCRTYWKSLIESDEEDSGAFAVTPNSGFLTSKEHHVTSYSQRLQISFTASENRQFKATVVIWSPLVKTPLLLQLQGTGSPGEKVLI